MNRRGVLLRAAAMVASWRAGAQEAPKSAHIRFIVTGGKGFPGHWFRRGELDLYFSGGENGSLPTVLRCIADNHIIAIIALYNSADTGIRSGCGIVIVGVGDA